MESNHPLSDFGRVIWHRRRMYGMTQAELAERSGVSVATISNFERGVPHYPRSTTLALILEALDFEQIERFEIHQTIKSSRWIHLIH